MKTQEEINRINQDIMSEFVNKHVYVCGTSIVEYILQKSFEDRYAPFNLEEVENYYAYPEFCGMSASFDGGTQEELDDFIENLEAEKERNEEKIKELEEERDLFIDKDDDNSFDEIIKSLTDEIESLTKDITNIENDLWELESLDPEPREIYEWWFVSDFLARKLIEMGYPVLKHEAIWGRCTSGQAIKMDWVIKRVCEDMEILYGQQYAWRDE